MSVESTTATMMSYLNSDHSGVSALADDVVFTIMDSGQEHRGPEAVMGMLNYFYQVAFDARADTKNLMITDGHAHLEADFIGKHTGDFAGIPATGRDVNVPIAVTYDLENDRIKRGRVYFATMALMQQLGVLPGPEAAV